MYKEIQIREGFLINKSIELENSGRYCTMQAVDLNTGKNSRVRVSACTHLYGPKVLSELFRVGCSQKN